MNAILAAVINIRFKRRRFDCILMHNLTCIYIHGRRPVMGNYITAKAHRFHKRNAAKRSSSCAQHNFSALRSYSLDGLSRGWRKHVIIVQKRSIHI
ncbi:hypothetical protein D3C81_1979770 [compost metagenome]